MFDSGLRCSSKPPQQPHPLRRRLVGGLLGTCRRLQRLLWCVAVARKAAGSAERRQRNWAPSDAFVAMPEGVPEGWRAWVPRVELLHVLANYGDDLVGKLSGDVAGGVVIASETPHAGRVRAAPARPGRPWGWSGPRSAQRCGCRSGWRRGGGLAAHGLVLLESSTRSCLAACCAVMLIPQGLAYATLAGLPPLYGLYTAVIGLLAYPLFGSSPHLAVGPTAMQSLLVAGALAPFEDAHCDAGDFANVSCDRYIQLAMTMSFLVGKCRLARLAARTPSPCVGSACGGSFLPAAP